MSPRILVIVPHPDDEAYSFGGTIRLAAASGAHIEAICVSRGELGERHDRATAGPESLGEIREAEFRVSCAILGVAEATVWGLPDGGLSNVGKRGATMIADAIDSSAADLVMALGADGAYGHPDHVAVFHWVRAAVLDRTSVAGLFASFVPGVMLGQYNVCLAAGVLGQPPKVTPKDLGDELAHYEVGTGHVRRLKLDAIAAHRTQLPNAEPRKLFPNGIVDELLNVERFLDAEGTPNATVAQLLAGFSDR